MRDQTFSAAAVDEKFATIYVAIELSKKSWVVGLRTPLKQMESGLWGERRNANELYATIQWLDDVNWPYIKDDYLKLVFAEAKITGGQGNPEKWYSMISPNQYQQLKDRVDIDFAPTNPKILQSTDDVNLDLFVKNVEVSFAAGAPM